MFRITFVSDGMVCCEKYSYTVHAAKLKDILFTVGYILFLPTHALCFMRSFTRFVKTTDPQTVGSRFTQVLVQLTCL